MKTRRKGLLRKKELKKLMGYRKRQTTSQKTQASRKPVREKER